MSTHKYIDRICLAAVLLTLVLTMVFLNGENLGIQAASSAPGYENRLFATGTVHTIDIVMADWEGFLEGCTDEEYVLCDLVIDNEAYTNVAIRAKGNTSLTQVASYGNGRYSFKVEFDHYDSAQSYYGLDKLSLNNIIQDNTYVKDYLCYQMMSAFGVDAPLCSFVYITVNGEDWGLYLAVEGVEEAFLERNYGSNYGELYKPDSVSMGGGPGNGGGFDMEDWMAGQEGQETEFPEFGAEMAFPDLEEGGGLPEAGDQPGSFSGMGSEDVSLIYTDDDYDSYANIFDNAKTDISDADRDRLIASLKQLGEGTDVETVVDVDEVIRYFVVHNFVCNFDSYTGSMIHNYYLYEEDGVLSMIPWDYNLAFGGFQGAEDATVLVNYPIDTPVSGGTVESRPMLAWIFASETYTERYHQYFADFLAQYFESGYFTQMMEETYDLVAPYVERDPTKFCTYEEFETGFAALESFCLLRAESVAGQLDGTIPSTEEGQAADNAAFVDASGIRISDMGGMNAGAGGAMGGMDAIRRTDTPGDAAPDDGTRDASPPELEGTASAPGGTAAPETSAPGAFSDAEVSAGETGPADAAQESAAPAGEDVSAGEMQTETPAAGTDLGGFSPPGDAWNGMADPPGGLEPDAVVSGGTQDAALLGVCFLTLLAGLAFAFFYRRR